MFPEPEVLLETSRMYFRNFRVDDARLLFELDSDVEVMRFISKGQPTALTQIQQDILPRFLDYCRLSPPRGFWAAHLRENDEFLGWFHLRPDKLEPAEMELGYRLKRSVWGRGLATEGSRSLIKKAFGEWKYAKVCARTLAVNFASRRVMEKAGLRFECGFVYGMDTLPDWTEAERRAVKYSLTRDGYLAAGGQAGR